MDTGVQSASCSNPSASVPSISLLASAPVATGCASVARLVLGMLLIGLGGWSDSAFAAAISSFTPTRGEAGTSVRINGSGFSTNAEENLVTFNGVPAWVDSATATRLMVSVPDSAISGPISVTINGQTATSSAVFRASPEIHVFTPGGPAGSAVTIRGINFGETPAANLVDFNGVPANVLSASAGQLVVTAPSGVTSGPITVAAYGYSRTTQSGFVSFVAPSSISSEVLYASSSDTGGVIALDARTGRPFAAFTTGRGARPMVANTTGSRLYVSNQWEDSVSIVDTATHAVLATVPTDANPDTLAIDTAGNYVYSVGLDRVTVIGTGTNSVIASIDPGIGLEYGFIRSSGADPARNTLYVFYYRYSGGAGATHLARIDMASGTLVDNRLIASLNIPYYLRADPVGGHLHLINDSSLVVLDPATGTIIAARALGNSNLWPEVGVSGDPVYVLAPHEFFAIDPATGNQRWSLPTPGYAERLRIGPGEFEAYLSYSAPSGYAFAVVDLHERAMASAFPADVGVVSDFLVSTGGEHAYLLGYLGELKMIDTVSRAVVESSMLGSAGSLLIVNTLTADRLGVVRRLNSQAFGDVYVDAPFEVVVQARRADGPATVVAATAVNVSLAPGGSGTLGGPAGCTIPAGGSHCLVRGLVMDTRQIEASLIATAASGDALAFGASTPFAVVGTIAPTITELIPDRGPVGATIRIIGTDLKQDAGIEPEVSFNGVPATVISSADHELVAIVPSGATTGPVSVHVSGQMAESPHDFTVLPVPTIAISRIEPAVALAGAPYLATVAVTGASATDPVPTGSVVVTDHTNAMSCTFVLPQTGCRMTAPQTSPEIVLLSATYEGDAFYGGVTSASVSHRIAFYMVAIEIGDIIPETLQAGQSSFVFFKIKPAAQPWHNVLPTGPIWISDGTRSCQYGVSYQQVSIGGCSLLSASAGPRTLVAYFPGDANYASAQSQPVTQLVSSPGGTTPLPAGTELCGFDPAADYPSQSGFVPVTQLSGSMPSFGLNRSILGTGPVTVTVASPSAGATVSGHSVDVAGTFEGPVNTGITVNGAVAATVNGRFLAAAVPLREGANTLDVVATTMTGSTAATSVTVQASPDPAPIAIEASDQIGQIGFGPFPAVYRLIVEHLPDDTPIQLVRIDLNGDGVWDHESATLDGVPTTYVIGRPGLYRARFQINRGDFFADRYILVRDRAAQRSMLCDIYGYLRDRLAAQDLIGAGQAFHADRRNEYLDLLGTLGVQMPMFAERLGTVVDGQFSGSMADLMLVRDQPDQTRAGYPMRLMQGADGVWRILEM